MRSRGPYPTHWHDRLFQVVHGIPRNGGALVEWWHMHNGQRMLRIYNLRRGNYFVWHF